MYIKEFGLCLQKIFHLSLSYIGDKDRWNDHLGWNRTTIYGTTARYSDQLNYRVCCWQKQHTNRL